MPATRLASVSDTPRVTPQKPLEPAPGMVPRVTAIDVVRLLVELVAFGTLALWGFASWPFPWNVVAGIGAPLLAILVWALFVSPRAVFAVHLFVRAVVELLVYATATIAWWSMGQAWIGLAFGLVAVTVGVLSGRRRLS